MVRPDAKATRDHWDLQAATYDQAKARNDAYYRALKTLFDRAVTPSFRDSVLEVGCGTGGVLASLEPESGLGVDISEAMIERARARFGDNLSFTVADATEGPLHIVGVLASASGTLGGTPGSERVWHNRAGGDRSQAVA